MPFQGELSRDNKSVKMAALIPWEEFEERYKKNFSKSGVGHPALSVRMSLAVLIVKEELGVSDRACVGESRRIDITSTSAVSIYNRSTLG